MKSSSWTVIESLMQQQGVTKQALAAIAGVGPSAVTKWASGGSIRIQSVYRIAKHFGVEPITIIQAGIELDTPGVKEGEVDWRARALEAERKLTQVKKALAHVLRGVEELQHAVG